MKIVTIVGIRKSGKTSTVTALIEAIRARGQKVGTCKTIFCPSFSIDKPGSNTMRHHQAGSELVCSRARHETALLFPTVLPLSELLQAYAGFDYVLLEGDYRAPVSRIVCAHNADDALPRTNSQTIAFAGRVSEKPEINLPLPRFNALDPDGVNALLDWMDDHIPDVTPSADLDQLLPAVAGVTGDDFCQCGCHQHMKQAENDRVQVTVDGERLELTEEQRAILFAWAKEKPHA